MLLSPSNKLFGIWALLVLWLVFFTVTRKPALLDVFSDRLNLSDAVPIESFSHALAGRVVTVPVANHQPIFHQVGPGDTWYSIAKKYRVSDYNELAKFHRYLALREGMKLEIPESLREAP